MNNNTVLFVDDDPCSLSLGKIFLGSEFNLHLASNGREAWEILQKENIDLLVTDIDMPVMNGFELLEAIKNAQINIKTVVASAGNEALIEKRYNELGLEGYLPKPYKPSKLIEMLKAVLT